MGRKPNAVVRQVMLWPLFPNQHTLTISSEYFDRGDKLPDSSNRYAHTCKRCNEFVSLTFSNAAIIFLTLQQFPKGRIDGLMNHILRRCPNVSQEDRQIAFRAMNPSHLQTPRPLHNIGHMHDMHGQVEQVGGSAFIPFQAFRPNLYR